VLVFSDFVTLKCPVKLSPSWWEERLFLMAPGSTTPLRLGRDGCGTPCCAGSAAGADGGAVSVLHTDRGTLPLDS
jgi:hypothetical protein